MAMTPILNREQIRAYDAKAIEAGVPSLVLMENAGLGATAVITELFDDAIVDDGPVVIVCGRGNNGGDGFVVGRQLMANGYEVSCFVVGDPETIAGDARANLDAYRGLGGELSVLGDELDALRDAAQEASVVVDGVFGTGLDRVVEGRFADIIEAINEAPGARVALDIPSGIDCDT
jgi:NAD(P)H-hydrate epimerase